MNNPQDQPGASNTGRNPQNQPATPGNPRPTAGSPDSTTSGAAAASRKPTPVPNGPANQPATGSTSQQPTADRQGKDPQPNHSEGQLLDTAVQSGKKWIEDSGVLNSVNQLPQALKDFGNRAAARVGDLSTTQKVVGGALLAVGLGWLATRGKGKSDKQSAPYNYGRAKSESYGRQSYGYQAPDASTSRRTASSTTSRADSGSAYGSGSRYGNTSQSQTSGNTGIQSGSGRYDNGSGFGASASTDHGTQAAKGSSRSASGEFGSSSNE